MSPRVIQVIESEIERDGIHVRQYHTLDGLFLAEMDPFAPSLTSAVRESSPAPGVCAEPGPGGLAPCDLVSGHPGKHDNGEWTWDDATFSLETKSPEKSSEDLVAEMSAALDKAKP